MIETVEPLSPLAPDAVDVSYTCIECDGFYAHATSVPRAAAILNRRQSGPGILEFGGEYIHCGEAMESGNPKQRTIYAGVPTGGAPKGYLGTKTLHCRCGFQTEIPHWN
ncbi:hypothetical protein V3C33_00770 [Micrococcaceae bacterium Sec5.7]